MADKRDKNRGGYRDYSDDSWFTSLINGLSGSLGCCWGPILTAVGIVALVL